MGWGWGGRVGGWWLGWVVVGMIEWVMVGWGW